MSKVRTEELVTVTSQQVSGYKQKKSDLTGLENKEICFLDRDSKMVTTVLSISEYTEKEEVKVVSACVLCISYIEIRIEPPIKIKKLKKRVS